MQPRTVDEVLDLLDASFGSAAVGAGLELGLFWLLEDRPLDAREVAREFGIPPARCDYWLQLLCRAGLLERGPGGFAPSDSARTAILGGFSQGSWALLAEEARERLPGLRGLPLHIREPGSAWDTLGLKPRMYLARMAEDPGAARRFTRMLYELHGPLADRVADFLDLDGVERLMDLGGGSGVISMALARRHPHLRISVVDIANVCTAGREMAEANSLGDRITYHAMDFLQDTLPSGFDVVMECDVNVYSEALFRKVHDSLDPGGRFVLLDQLAPAEGIAPPPRLHWAFEGSMVDPEFAFLTAAAIRKMLESAGFEIMSERPLPELTEPCKRFTEGMIAIEARKQPLLAEH